MDKPGSKRKRTHPAVKSCETPAPEQPGHEHEDRPRRGSSPETDSELQASLHSRKEQERRLQIRTSCRRLCELLPFVSGHLDTATTLELTAKYMSYLKQTLPQDVLTKVHKAVEENMKSSWKKPRKPPKKRKTIRLKRNTSQIAKPSAKKSTKVHISRRQRPTWHKNSEEVNQPSISISLPLMMDQALSPAEGPATVHAPPILLDKSAVPRGQMLPVCQNQFPAASFQSVENNWMNSSSAFPSPASSSFTSAVIGQTFLEPSSSHAAALEIWDGSAGLANPAALPPANVSQPYNAPDQASVMTLILPLAEHSQGHAPLAGLNENTPAVDVMNQALVPLVAFQGATLSSDVTSERLDLSVSDTPCNLRPLEQSSLCSFSPWTHSSQDTVSPFWLDLLLDTNDSLCVLDAPVENIALSPYKDPS
ncbi:uncharacterized protein LOC115370309 isoform X2 [Myripristis murdjan]|uniref:uncharacterized protein LOC115370309 isoform X2 n=1 Tax=Myripristis murdjan TaxID=586833 RepID=UPI001175E556|nr:spermatogenesis- and oogenesis-specific basic helix-loop-helix-containing protein 2 isoform X2 [Myripristis murdjan]